MSLQPAGYSGTPLPRKLGLKDGQAVAFVGLPPSLETLTRSATFREVARCEDAESLRPGAFDIAHAFYTREAAMKADLPVLKNAIKPAGVVWVSWPKQAAVKAQGLDADLTENAIRAHALAGGLVDIKVYAVDETWSGLKLVIPIAARAAATDLQ